MGFQLPTYYKTTCKEKGGGEYLVLLEKIHSPFNHDDCLCLLTSN